MGFLKQLRKREPSLPPEKKERKEMGIEDFDAWLKAEFGVRESEAADSLAGVCRDVEMGFMDAGIALAGLEKAKMRAEGDVCTRMNMIKASFATKAGAGIASAPRLRSKTWDGFSQFLDGAKKAVRDAGDVSPKQGYVLSTYFREEGAALSESMRRVGISIDALAAKMGEHAFMATLRDAKAGADELSHMVARKGDADKRASAAAASMRETEKQLATVREKAHAVVSSKAWKDAQKKRQMLEGLQEEVASLESALRNEIGGVARLMKKLAHETADKDAETFSEDPLAAVETYSKQRIESLFAKANQAAKSGNLKAKDSEIKKMQKLEDSVAGILDSRARLAGLRKSVKCMELEVEGSEALARMKEAHATEAALEKAIMELADEERAAREESMGIGESIDAKRVEIEQLMGNEGRPVKLKI